MTTSRGRPCTLRPARRARARACLRDHPRFRRNGWMDDFAIPSIHPNGYARMSDEFIRHPASELSCAHARMDGHLHLASVHPCMMHGCTDAVEVIHPCISASVQCFFSTILVTPQSNISVCECRRQPPTVHSAQRDHKSLLARVTSAGPREGASVAAQGPR